MAANAWHFFFATIFECFSQKTFGINHGLNTSTSPDAFVKRIQRILCSFLGQKT